MLPIAPTSSANPFAVLHPESNRLDMKIYMKRVSIFMSIFISYKIFAQNKLK
jgi:hypothetical protein